MGAAESGEDVHRRGPWREVSTRTKTMPRGGGLARNGRGGLRAAHGAVPSPAAAMGGPAGFKLRLCSCCAAAAAAGDAAEEAACHGCLWPAPRRDGRGHARARPLARRAGAGGRRPSGFAACSTQVGVSRSAAASTCLEYCKPQTKVELQIQRICTNADTALLQGRTSFRSIAI